MCNLINLKEKFGDKYRITKDPAVEKGTKKVDPIYWIIPCRLGEIFPYGGKYLAVMVTKPRIAQQMKKWKELEVTQDAEDAVIFKFHVKDFDKIAERVLPHKRPKISNSERAKRSQRMKESKTYRKRHKASKKVT